MSSIEDKTNQINSGSTQHSKTVWGSVLRISLLAMLSFAAGIFTTVFCAYEQSGGVPYRDQKPIFLTQNALGSLDRDLNTYVQNQGSSPNDLNELAQHLSLATANPARGGVWVDGWGWDIQYQKTGPVSFDLYSWGRDGGSGGSGADAEYRLQTPNYGQVDPVRYISESLGSNLLTGAVVTGLALLVITLSSDYGMSWGKTLRLSPLRYGVNLFLIAVGSVVMGFLMSIHYAVDMSIGGH
ncbi:MAG: type II secretion system protein GspG [Planctomycetota bacterium]